VSSSVACSRGAPEALAASRSSMSATKDGTHRGPGGAQGLQSQNFLRLVERSTDAFVGNDDKTVEDVRRTLLQVRQQYDSVHHEAEQKDAQLRRAREEIRTFDGLHGQKADERDRLEGSCAALEMQYNDTLVQIAETKTSRKVYEHMLARIQKEQAILKEKMLKMEEHLGRKTRERHRKVSECDRTRGENVKRVKALEVLDNDAEVERDACRRARDAMDAEVRRRQEANSRRADFESWRHEIALEAANDAFNASAGRLRKLYAIEKLAGNCLQKITFEQVERSQNTEDGFQKIRDVTGLADVMDIVHKFLNREVEHEQLLDSVKNAEITLETLRQGFEAFKQQTEGITFDPSSGGRSGDMYKEIEQTERDLNDAMEEHEKVGVRLQKTTLQVEHMKWWTAKVGNLVSSHDEPVRVEGPQDLLKFFKHFHETVGKFVHNVNEQIVDGKITRKALVDTMRKEYNEQALLLRNKDFLEKNCRVPPTADGRSTSRQESNEDDPATAFNEEREKHKKEALEKLDNEMKAEQQKQRIKGKGL